MTAPRPEGVAKVTEVPIPSQYESQEFWLVLPINGYGDPKIRKTDPGVLGANECCVRLELLVPKQRRRVAQTIRVKLPDEFAHLNEIEVSVPDAEPAK